MAWLWVAFQGLVRVMVGAPVLLAMQHRWDSRAVRKCNSSNYIKVMTVG
jgi:hypothetical protein